MNTHFINESSEVKVYMTKTEGAGLAQALSNVFKKKDEMVSKVKAQISADDSSVKKVQDILNQYTINGIVFKFYKSMPSKNKSFENHVIYKQVSGYPQGNFIHIMC